MLWNYTILILCILLVLRWWQLKRSIKKRDYDYSYYEEGPYGEPQRTKNWWQQVKEWIGLK